MSGYTLLKTFNYASVPDTPFVGTGQYLLPGQKDNKGGVWKVLGGKLICVPQGANPLYDNHLYFDGYTTSDSQKMVITGLLSNKQLCGLLKFNFQNHTGFIITALDPQGVSAYKLQSNSTSSVVWSYQIPSFISGHVYQIVIEMGFEKIGGQCGTKMAVFDLTSAGVNQPVDPVNFSDPGAVYYVDNVDRADGETNYTGFYGLAGQYNQEISQVRLYAPEFTAVTSNSNCLQTLQFRQRIFLSGHAWYSGMPIFTGLFTPGTNETGTTSIIEDQKIIDSDNAILTVTCGTAKGSFVVTDGLNNVSVTIPVISTPPSVLSKGYVTAKTYNGSNSVKMDGTDETERYQDFIDFLMRYLIKGFQEPGQVLISFPIIQRGFRATGTDPGGQWHGFVLEGMGGLSGATSSGCCVIMIADNQRAMWEINDDSIINSKMMNINFFGNSTTSRIFYAPIHHFSNYDFHSCNFQNAETLIDVDNQVIIPPYTTKSGNGEYMNFTNCTFSFRKIAYRNASLSGQAYCHRFINCAGGSSENGAVFLQVGNIAGGGNQIDVSSQSLTMINGPLSNVLLDLNSGSCENINFHGGRFEHMQTAVRYVPAGYFYNGSVNISGCTFTSVDEGKCGPLIHAVNSDGSEISGYGHPGSLLINLSSNAFESSGSLTGDKKLHIVFGGVGDKTTVILDSNHLQYINVDDLLQQNVVARTNIVSNSDNLQDNPNYVFDRLGGTKTIENDSGKSASTQFSRQISR